MTKREAKRIALEIAGHTLVAHDWSEVSENMDDHDKIAAEIHALGRKLLDRAYATDRLTAPD